MTFEIMAYVMTLGACVLGLRFLFASASVLKEWSVEATTGSVLMGRRLGVVYLGLALMFFLGRSAGPSALRSGVCLGVGGASALLAAVGLLDLRARRVSARIIVPSAIETVLAAGFLWAWWGGR